MPDVAKPTIRRLKRSKLLETAKLIVTTATHHAVINVVVGKEAALHLATLPRSHPTQLGCQTCSAITHQFRLHRRIEVWRQI